MSEPQNVAKLDSSIGPLGEVVDVSKPCTAPERIEHHGKYCNLIPWTHAHTEEMFQFMTGPENESIFYFWPGDPYPDVEAFDKDMQHWYESVDPLCWAIIDLKSGKCKGQAILGDYNAEYRYMESGMFITVPLQKTIAATEAFYLIARYTFDLGFRRLQWKTNTLNMPSRRAAERYGMQLEGIFRQHQINKGRNRDSAWYAMIDKEWPVRKLAFEKWLEPSNFDAEGKQKASLMAIRNQLEADGSADED